MHHETRYLIYIILVFGTTAIILQSLIVPLIEITVWRPDFVLIVVLLISKRFGTVPGSTSGFVLGLLQDALTSLPVGITAFSKALVGYALGKFKTLRLDSGMYYLWFVIMIFIHELIFYGFLQFKIEASYTYLIFSRVFPNTVYSTVMLLLINLFTHKYFRE